ncbi:acyl-ACP--UDP-N-acetylglucosamine O-acyltransferase [Pseudobacteriovorax antillogorgiicola]|uniref:Acyl-[acyl-carrier-protein]--UDP-N-acetylglucosamine O-acyltransferase n=1 Tax=Pseudobacteriovorax antillogorgiicola TaxID=1513793 RepID=A0A1Y6BBP8_9BACT|nr:acyl-ACP--UDP-N-acetylglucosamine O-acyltransferase [Pseudobacteriovorax antillogorgiicola]TCS57584.1 acyl-[acyl-carrier-protein]--UDP-N-acetylglucosamine O-acyltransferase [Pseudobacteriovorax antillogorgiicola]SME99580.1 acyl-[acyl-carrier-protein]--UDP-N-acetylglucosamine O-acyltransferase [Pseudobacteriovorax antillogorgiicola]
MFDYSSFEPQTSRVGDTQIHPSAIVAKEAQLDRGVVIGPNAIVGPRVSLGKNVQIGAGAIISGTTTVGEASRIFPFATVGSDPQDLKYEGEETIVKIGKNNNIREYVNISCGTVGGGGETTMGDNNLIMVYSHVAHDCHIGSNCVFANGVQLAGHVVIGNQVVFGGMSGAHQFCRFGDRAMIAAGAIVVQDVPPYCMVQGDRARISGLNVVGLRRSGMPRERISLVKNMFKILYNDNLTLEDAIEKIVQDVEDAEERSVFLDFLRSSERGVCR